MNREQAEHILDAYLSMYCVVKADGMHPDRDVAEASTSLREVILDAMTQYKASTSASFNGYGITIPTNYPTNWDGTPKVTCTGIDPAFNTDTVSTVDGMATMVGYQNGVVKVVGE